jgi:hypothetical protein
MRRRLLTLAALLLVGAPTPASAQDFGLFTGIFKNVSSFTIYTQGGNLQRTSGLVPAPNRCAFMELCGGGMELLIDLNPAAAGASVEIGVGASFLSGFALHDPAVDLRGSVRAFPTLSGYFTFPAGQLEPFIGVSFGLADLWQMHAYSTDSINRQIPVSGQTFEYGGSIGTYLGIGPRHGLFAELGYRERRFNSVRWENSAPPRPELRALDFSGTTFSIGVQFDLSPRAPAPTPLTGYWDLADAGGALPFLMSAQPITVRSSAQPVTAATSTQPVAPGTTAQPGTPGTSTPPGTAEEIVRHDLVGGTLELHENTRRFHLQLQRRDVNRVGEVDRRVQLRERDHVHGSFTVKGDTVFLQQDGQLGAYPAIRIGSELRVTMPVPPPHPVRPVQLPIAGGTAAAGSCAAAAAASAACGGSEETRYVLPLRFRRAGGAPPAAPAAAGGAAN